MRLQCFLFLLLLGLMVQARAATPPLPVGPEYDTVAEILAHLPPTGALAKSYQVKGRGSMGDLGGGQFFWVKNSTLPTNNGTVFAWAGGRLIRQFDGPIYATWFGASTNTTVDSTVAIQSALDTGYPQVVLPPGTYKTTAPLRKYADRQSFAGLGTGPTAIYFLPTAPGSALVVGRPGGNSTVFPMVSDISFITDTNNPYAKVAIELHDVRYGYFHKIQTGPNWTGPSTNNIGILVKGRDQTLIADCVFQADIPFVIDRNPESFIDFDHFTVEKCSFLAESGNPNMIVRGNDVMWSDSRVLVPSWNKVCGFVWVDSGLTRRSFNLVIDGGRMEQSGSHTNDWNIRIELGTLDKLGSGGNVLQGFTLANFDTDGFQNGVKLRGVVNTAIRNTQFLQYNTNQAQLDFDDTCNRVETFGVFSQQGSTIRTTGMINVKKSPGTLGNTPMSEENLWIRDNGNFHQWEFTDSMFKGGVGAGTDEMPTGTPVPPRGGMWSVAHDNTTNLVHSFLAMRLRDNRTNVFRGTSYEFAEFESSFLTAPVYTGSIVAGPESSESNWYTDMDFNLNLSLTAAANDPLALTNVMHFDGKDQFMSLGPNRYLKDYFDGRRTGVSMALTKADNTDAPIETFSAGRQVSAVSANPRANEWNFYEDYGGPRAYTGSIVATRLDSSHNYYSQLSFRVSDVFGTGTPTSAETTTLLDLTGGAIPTATVTGDLAVTGNIAVDEMTISTMTVTNFVSAGTYLKGNEVRMKLLTVTPTAAAIGAGGATMWSSNAFVYVTYSANGVSATTKLIAP